MNFSEATQLDPDYVRAWLAIADNASSMLDTGQISQQTYLAAAGPVLERALKLNDKLPEVHAGHAEITVRYSETAEQLAAIRALPHDKKLKLKP